MPIIENSSGDGSLGDCLAKNKFGTDMLGLLSPKTSVPRRLFIPALQ
jgi:hypothetical protein